MYELNNTLKILGLLVLTFFIFSVVRAEKYDDGVTISGHVRDASSGEELIGVNIVVEELNTGATTNFYGFYSLTLPRGSYKVSYMYIGYETVNKNIDFNSNTTLNIEMDVAYIESEAIIVTAEKEDENIQSIEMSVAEFDSRTIQKVPAVLGEIDLIKTVQLLPGVSTAGEGASGFFVRGSSTDQNLILLDESPIYNASHLFGFFSIFNSDATKDVKLFKAGIPSKYGGRLSSVMDVRQREGNNKKFKITGGLGLISSRLTVEGPIQPDKSSFLVAGRRSYGDLFLPLFNNQSTAYFYDLNFKSNYILSDQNRIFASGYFGRDKFEIDDVFGQRWGNSAFTLRWNHLFSDQIFSNFSAIYSKYNYGLQIFADGSAFDWSAYIENVNIKGDFTYYIDDKHTLDFGADAIFYEFAPGKISPLKNSTIITQTLDRKYAIEPALYVNYDHKWNDDLSLQYGLRFSSFFRTGKQTIFDYLNDQPIIYNNRLGRYEEGIVSDSTIYNSNDIIDSFYGIEPRFSARYAFNDQSSVKFSYNRTRQYIHLISNNTAPSPLDVWTPSGPYLKPQISDQFALGYFRNFADNAYESSIEVYYKDLQNQLDYVPGARLAVNNTLETEVLQGPGRAYGAEFYLKKKTGRLTGWISYTLSKTERKFGGISPLDPGINNGEYYPSSFDRTHDLSITGIYELNKKWTLSSNFVLTSGRPITYPTSRYEFADVVITQYEGRNSDRLPIYHRLDISATLHDVWHGDWIFSLYNIYNRQNATSITFRPNEDNPIVTEAVRTTIFGIVPSITYNFKF